MSKVNPHVSYHERYEKFREELEHLINRNSMENGSNTPDFLLAEYLTDCLLTFDKIVGERTKWMGLDVAVVSVPQPNDTGPTLAEMNR